MIVSTNHLAQALFEVGIEDKDPISFYQELKDFNELLHEPLVNEFFNLTYDRFESVEDELSALFSREFTNYLGLLYENKAIQHMDNIIKYYRDLLVEYGYMNEVEIISPKPLSDDLKTKLEEQITSRYVGLHEINYHEDKDLIGGLYVRINDDIYDTSIKSKLEQVVKHGGVSNGKTIRKNN